MLRPSVVAGSVAVLTLAAAGAFAQGEPGTAEAFCAKADECNMMPNPACVAELQAQLDATEGQGDPLCTELFNALTASLDCQAAADCADLATQTVCVEENNAVNELLFDGAQPCRAGEPPIVTPDGWICAAAFFGVGDGCDCGCGAEDTDCGVDGGCTVPGCVEEICEFCYADAESAAAGVTINDVAAPNCGQPVGGEGEGEGEGEGVGEGEGETGDDDDDDSGSGGCNATSASREGVLGLALVALWIRRRLPR